MNRGGPIRVVGVGSAHGDDAVAWCVIEELRKRGRDPDGAETHCVDGGQRLLDLLDGQGALVLVDALRAGELPGSVHRLRWPEPGIEALRPGSTHDLSPAEALRLAEALGSLPPEVIIIGVEISEPSPLPGLTLEVAAAAEIAVAAVLTEIESLRAATTDARQVHHA